MCKLFLLSVACIAALKYMLSCRWELLAFGRRMQFSKSVCIFIYMLLSFISFGDAA